MQNLNLNLNVKEGYITLSYKSEEPRVSAEVVLVAQALLQKYITEFKIEKVRSNLEFVEKNPKAMECVKENLKFTRLEKKGLTLTKDVMNALYQLEGEKVFDFVFMDPPYNMGFEKRVLEYLAGSDLIYEDTVIIVEASLDTDFGYLPELGYSLIKEKRYKTNKHVFIEKAGKEEVC